MSVKDCFLTLIITGIPPIGLIMLFVWAFSEGTNITKRNYAIGALILIVALFAFYLLLVILAVIGLFSGLESYST